MLTEAERAHAQSILDSAPTLEPIPPLKKPRILVASVVRKPPEVLNAFFASLRWQEVKADLAYDFVNNFSAGDSYATAALAEYAGMDGTDFRVSDAPAPDGDYAQDGGAGTRGWTPQAWHRVGALKNRFIQRTLSEGFDYLWLVDADVLCDPWTLQSALDCEVPVVSSVYWTKWSKPKPGDAQVQHAGPQVWLRHPYELSGRGFTEAEFREALVTRRRLRVWGLGACTLLSREALAKGLSFSKFAELPPGAMSDGEDRHFCMRAEALHVPLYADAWPDIYHAYHPSDYGDITAQMAELCSRSALSGQSPRLGWNVSLKLENLEVPGLPPQHVRGRLGQLRLLPQIEERLYEMRPRESSVLKVHFPEWWPSDARSQDCVLRVTLLDTKPYRLPPVVGDEYMVGVRSGARIDHTTMTQAQLEDIAGV